MENWIVYFKILCNTEMMLNFFLKHTRKYICMYNYVYRRYFNIYVCASEKAMAPHSSTLAWEIPWLEEPGRLQSMGPLKSRTRLSDFTFISHFHALEKEMATHSSVLAWRIPGTEEPGGLLSMGSARVGHNWSDLAVAWLKKNCWLKN